MFTLRLRAFYILSTLRRSASIPRAAATVSKAYATELEYSSSPSTWRGAANKTAVITGNNREKKITIRIFNLEHLADLRPVGCSSAHPGGGGGGSSWFQLESLNQSINHRRKGFQRRLDSSWNTSRYIFHATSLKSLSFDINSRSGPQRPWAVHLHTGQAGPVQSSLYSPCPGRFTVQQLCTPNSTSAPDKYRRLREQRVFSWRVFFEARTRLHGGVSPGIMKGAIRGARNPPNTCRSKDQIGPQTSLLHFTACLCTEGSGGADQ